MTEAMLFLQKTILLSYDPRPFTRALLQISIRERRKRNPMNPQKKFWKWRNQVDGEPEARVLELYGTIASESWFDDDVTPQMFKDELFSGDGDVVIYLNSPGGDCIAASQIYTMLMDYPGNVTIKIDGIAASAASVIAMAGTSVLMAPTSLMMIHNPMTAAFGSKDEMEKAIEMLEEVKESIINVYELRTGLSRARISHLMDSETWMNANRAIELGFADGMLTDEKITAEMPAFEFSDRAVEMALINKITQKTRQEKPVPRGRSVDELMERLSLLKN